MNKFETFKTIVDFIYALREQFQEKHRPLKLYGHLMSRTTFEREHEKAIDKHISIFNDFCNKNKIAILSRDISLLISPRIQYSSKVFIDMDILFDWADEETKEVMWDHLVAILSKFDLSTDVVKSLVSTQKNQTKSQTSVSAFNDTDDFLSDIIKKVEANITPETSNNPMAAISSIMQSGLFTELVSGMAKSFEDGNMDLQKLSGSVSKLVGKVSAETGDVQGGEQAMEMVNNLMGSLTAGMNNASNSQEVTMPDISGLMTAFGGLNIPTSSASENNQDIKTLLDNEYQKAKTSGLLE